MHSKIERKKKQTKKTQIKKNHSNIYPSIPQKTYDEHSKNQ